MIYEKLTPVERGRTNIHRHARRPLAPSNPPTIPAAISPENAPEIRDPEYNIAVLNASSFLVYQDDKKNRHPGK